jgi:hypothetical protein
LLVVSKKVGTITGEKTRAITELLVPTTAKQVATSIICQEIPDSNLFRSIIVPDIFFLVFLNVYR